MAFYQRFRQLIGDRKHPVHTVASILAVVAAVLGLWSFFNRPVTVADWPELISGFSFAPYRQGQGPAESRFPSQDEIREDLALVTRYTDRIRTYSVADTLGDIPELAADYGLQVTMGMWIEGNAARDWEQIDRGIAIARRFPRTVEQIILGNESIHRGDVTVEEMIEFLDYVQDRIGIPVSTAEPWYIYVEYPELINHVDFIAAHVLPYWENIPVEESVQFVLDRARDLSNKFPYKPLLLGEVGWPSQGRTRGQAEASLSAQATYLRQLVNELNLAGYRYFVIEAFDQPWKQSDEGAVGAYWGVWDQNRQSKWPMTGPVEEIPQWRVLALMSVLLGLLSLAMLLIDGSELRQRGKAFLAITTFASATMLVFIAYDYSLRYVSVLSMITGALLSIGAVSIILVLYTEAHELAEAAWMRQRRRNFEPVTAENAYRPKVSVHVPCYNEPPDMVIDTINALAALDYPDYEVLIIDNNTKDPAVWEPVQAHCEKLGPRFRFFHVAPLSGFKAGALNFAMRQMAPDTEVIAVIDSDYMVDPNWLKHLVPHFEDPDIAVVQAPQDYRDDHESLFKKMCYAEYKGFFHIGMVTRNDRDAIIQHGTMTMMRRSVLQRIGWAEWCITEDAELGLTIFEEGLSAAYFDESYGKGLMPDTFMDFKKQRFRWAYGAVQILKRHKASLFLGKGTQLTRGQRYHFLAGWLPWGADAISMVYTLGAIFWGLAMILAPHRIDPPLVIFAWPPMFLFLFKVGKVMYLYKQAVRIPLKQAFYAALAGLALTHTVAKAVLYGVFTSSMPFFRTPKTRSEHGFMRALAESREELYIMLTLWGVALGINLVQPVRSMDVWVWTLLLLIQSLPYLASVIMACIAALPGQHEAEAAAASQGDSIAAGG